MSGTRALLLTDVVDSTALAERLGDAAMAGLWARHDRVARDLLPVHHGREIDKTDGFLLLFEAAEDAVAYALAYHRAIAALGLKARAGLHVGPVILTENPAADVARGAKPLEVDGLAKPTAARIMGLASGGQTLLSTEARAALGATPLRVESHGHWRMKGVSEPIELFEVGDDDAPFTPPPDGAKVYRVVRDGQHWLPVKQVKHSLPRERDAFVGRSADLQQLARLLDDGAALVSVLGIGGTGKTRLVTHYGWTWLGDWPGGVWFCDLSEARSVDGIVHAVARALDVPLGKDDPVVQLGHAIAGRGRCLVLLDNFEQVARQADETLGRWLDRAHEAAFVVTTREVLGLPGETALTLAPLPASDGAVLFVARARSAKRDFEPDDVVSIDALVKLLDGLPLAIELAAARVRVMPPKTLLARMSERFKLLASTGGRHSRQATLRGALDWSWDLLSADEQAALAQLSVFEGGFTLEAAEGVLSLDKTWPMDAVQALVDKSLVRQVGDDRFDLLVSVQEYATEKLGGLDAAGEAEARHGAWFATFGTSEALESLDAHGGIPRHVALRRELDNLVTGCGRAVERGEGPRAMALLRAAWVVMELRGPYLAAVALAERVVGLPGLSPREGAVARQVLGAALQSAGRMDEARAHHDAALAVAREVGDRRSEGIVLRNLGMLHAEQGRVGEARAHYDAALAVHREIRDRSSEGAVLGNLGVLHADQGRMDEAHGYYDAALAVHREIGNRRVEGVVLFNRGVLHVVLGRLDDAGADYDAALAVHREVGDLRREGMVLHALGTLHADQGRMDEARAHYELALVVAREVGSRSTECFLRGSLGNLHADQGRMDEARTHYDAALAVAREIGNRRAEGHVLVSLGLLHAEQGRMDEARACYDAALAVTREVGDRLAEGIALGNLGKLHHQQGRMDEARAHYEAALAVARDVGHRRLEGHVLGNLGELHLALGGLADARACVEQGEPLLREVQDLNLLSGLLCVRARLERVRGDLPAARATLVEVEALAAALGANADSGLGRMLAEARIAVEAP